MGAMSTQSAAPAQAQLPPLHVLPASNDFCSSFDSVGARTLAVLIVCLVVSALTVFAVAADCYAIAEPATKAALITQPASNKRFN